MAFHLASLSLIFAVLGNVISIMVTLAPVPTFYQIYKKKSTEAFQALPYIFALFSAMLWIYYAFAKPALPIPILTINSFACVLETIYLAIFLIYAPNKARLATIKIILLLNVFGFGGMMLSTLYLTTGATRLKVIGWISLVFNICVFASPLGSLRHVIKTKSVEFMPINLSFFLTLNAVMWFFYGLLMNDYFVALPNTLGFVFGVTQMVLYVMYRKNKKVIIEDPVKLQELNNNNNNDGHVIDVVKLSNTNYEAKEDVVAVNVTTIEDSNEKKETRNDSHNNNVMNSDPASKV